MGPEAKFYQYFKKNTPNISYTRIENTSALGTPDVLAYNKYNVFFTIEFKVSKSKKVRFSPHQIAFHIKHPQNTFIIAEALGPRSSKLVHMYSGARILELDACGLKLEPLCLGLDACSLVLNQLGA